MTLGSFSRWTAAAVLALTGGVAHASFVGGTTSVTLDTSFVDTVTGAGLSVTPRGTATLGGSPLVAAFPITGNTPETQLFHEGSGLRFAGSGAFLDLDDYVIDLATGGLTATVNANGSALGSGVPLFDIDSSLNLSLTSTAATAIADVFGLGAAVATQLTGARVGQAAVAAPVPEPASLALLTAGLLGAGAAVRRPRRSGLARAA